MSDIRPVPRMLHGDGADAALGIQVQNGVLVQIAGLSYLDRPELDVVRVRVLEVFDLHPLLRGQLERLAEARLLQYRVGRMSRLDAAVHRKVQPAYGAEPDFVVPLSGADFVTAGLP